MMALRGEFWLLIVLLTPLRGRAASFGDIAVANGLHALELGDAASALAYLTPFAKAPPATLALCSQQAVARYLAGEAALRLARDDDALAYLDGLDAALREVEDLLWVLRGRAFLHKEAWAEAKFAWQQVQTTSPSVNWRAEADYSLGDIAWGQNNRVLAEQLYHQAIRTTPRHPRAALARLRLAQIAQAAGRFDKAAELLRKVALDKDQTLVRSAQAQLTRLQRSGKLSEQSVSSQLAYVDQLLLAHALEQACELIDALARLAHDPQEQQQLAQRRAQLAARARNYPVAIQIFTQLKQANTGRPRLSFQRDLALALAAAGQTDAALVELDDVAGHTPARKDARDASFRAAWLSYEAGRYKQAEMRFAAYIKDYAQDSNLEEVMWLHAWCAYHRGDYPSAHTRLIALQTRFGHGQLVQRAEYWLGRTKEQMGERQQGIAHMHRVAQIGGGYYTMLAQQRLGEWGGDANSLPWQRGELVASLVPMGLASEMTPNIAGAKKNDAVVTTPANDSSLPWEDDVFDWQSTKGARTLRLMQLGHSQEAALLIGTLPVVHTDSYERVEYARARLLFALHDYAAAFRSVGPSFRRAIEQGFTPQTRRYFQLAYPQAHKDLVLAAAQEFAVSPYLLLAVMRQESAYNDGANSAASARGLMQVIPVTGRKIADILHEPGYTDAALKTARTSVRFGAWYISQLSQAFAGHLPLAIASYNAGPKATTQWAQMRKGEPTDVFVEDISYKETRNYVKHVMANLAMYELIYRGVRLSVPTTIPERIGNNVLF